MDPPATDVEVKHEKFDEVNEAGPSFHCGLADTEIVHKIAQAFLPGLASACVDNTIGGLFKNPASVAVEIRKEMVQYLTQRSETFVAESVILEDGGEAQISDHPYDIVSDFVDDFSSSKRNFFSRVSGWLLSDMREDRIDDFVQEMEINGFWFMERREAIAQTLLKNVDFKNTYHCDKKFNSEEELQQHTPQCSFRTINCTNEGCNARFCAAQSENHDSACPFKILPCEQKCPQYIMRREMDKHCITLCTMKLVNCPFFPVGCQSTTPQCKITDHRSENLDSHLLYVLQVVHKGVSVKDLKKRVDQLIEAAYPGQLTEARDVRSLTFAVRGLEKNLGPLEISPESPVGSPKEKENRDSTSEKEEGSPSKKESPTGKEELVDSPEKKVDSSSSSDEAEENPHAKQEEHNDPLLNKVELSAEDEPLKKVEHTESPPKEAKFNEPSSPKAEEGDDSASEKANSPTRKEESSDSPPKKEENTESPRKEKSNDSSPKIEESSDSSSEKEDSPTRKEELPESPVKKEELTESPPKEEKSNASDDSSSEKEDSPSKKEELPDSPVKKEEITESPPKEEKSNATDDSSSEKEDSPSKKEELPDSQVKKEEHTESPPKKVESAESSPKSEDRDEPSSEKEDSPRNTESPSRKEKSGESSPKIENSGDSSSDKEEDSPPVYKETL